MCTSRIIYPCQKLTNHQYLFSRLIVDIFISALSNELRVIFRARIVGWPPVRSMRQKVLVVVRSIRKYVKVSADGAPYLRKLDLEMYRSYQELLRALERMFPIPSSTISGRYYIELGFLAWYGIIFHFGP